MNTYGVGAHLMCDFLFTKPRAICRQVIRPGNGRVGHSGLVLVEIQEDNKAYRKGELIEVSAYEAVPIKQLRHGQYFMRVDTRYEWK